MWTILENLFAISDIKKKLAVEAIMFDKVDKYFRNLLKTSTKAKFLNKIVNSLVKDEIKKNLETLI